MERRLIGDRVEFDNPWVELTALPAAVLFTSLFAWSPVGRVLLVPFQIQFHELGHAMMAWLSSRAALPLPFGFTFWTEEPSRFTGACMLFLIGVLFVRSLREHRRFAVLFACGLLLAFVILSGFVSVERSRMFLLFAGLAGELVLTSLVMIAFYFPFPDRMRWDFLRFVALLPAAGSWVSAVSMWRGVARGARTLPMGSLLGDGTGDLDRLMYEYAFSQGEIISFYGKLALSTVVLVVMTYAVFALRAGRKLGFVPAWD
ncbi:MAG TPA: hypothetical protein VFX59_04575 [Polyangiales bacterium]|nr:hypothetical protein [Polyangiales bacterium]